MISIYDVNDNLLLSVEVEDDSYIYAELKGECYAYIHFYIAQYTAITVGSYFKIGDVVYRLYSPHSIKVVNTMAFEYECTFYTPVHSLKMYKFREVVQALTGEWGGSQRIKFSLTAKPHEHLKMLVDNMNKHESGWSVGDCVIDSEHLINYSDTTCWDACGDMAEEFETEFEIIDKLISLKKVEYNKDNPISVSYGKGNGLISGVQRSNDSEKSQIGSLFVQGDDRNITYATYGNKYLLLPSGASIGFDGTYFTGETGYDYTKASFYKVSDDRLSIIPVKADLTGYEREESYDASGIYPSHTCTVSAVSIDSQGCYNVTLSEDDEDIAPYFVSNRVPDSYETIIFQDGELAGREFQVNPLNGGMTLQIIAEDEDGVTMPSEPFIPKVGDTLNVYNIIMPDEYIEDAEWEMFKDGVKYLYENGDQQVNISCTLDKIWLKNNWDNVGSKLVCGGYVSFTDTSIQPTALLMRITSVKQKFNDLKDVTIQLSNASINNRSINLDIKKANAQSVQISKVTNNVTTIINQEKGGDIIEWGDGR